MSYSNFYTDRDYKYPEIAILLEYSIADNYDVIGKFFIPAITPFIKSDLAYDKKDITPSKINIKNSNKSNLDINPCIISNYIELKIPEYLNIKNINKGDKFIVSFLGGDINKPFIFGRSDIIG